MSELARPLVSVCVPTYNSEATISETLTSILAQTYGQIEVLIVDNASTDSTLAIVERFRDPRMRVIRNAENIGAEGNFNRCIQLATGAYTAIYHADDIYLPEMVAEQVAFLEANLDTGGVLTEATVIDEGGASTGAILLAPEFRKPPHKADFVTLFRAVLQYSNFLICPSAMVRTPLLQGHIKAWRGQLFGSSADLDIWFRIAQLSKLGMLDRQLMKYRVSSEQFSARSRMQTGRADFFRVTDYYLKDPDVLAWMTATDWENYRLLERRDVVMRVTNLLIAHDISSARKLLSTLNARELVRAAGRSKRAFLSALIYAFLRLNLALGTTDFASWCLRTLKSRMAK